MAKILKFSIVLLIIFSTSSFVFAKFSIPSYVYTVDQLDSARSIAENSETPIAFVYTNKNTDCGLATAASKDLFQGLKKYCMVVYAEQKDWGKLPRVVQRSIELPESGQYIPKTIIVDSSCNKMICVIPYAKPAQRQQLIKQAQKLISNY